MILLINTSTGTCDMWLMNNSEVVARDSWLAERNLADGLLSRLESLLGDANTDWHGLTGIGLFGGPGSFTGLRIGASIANTLADALDIPIVRVGGESWRDEALTRLERNENDTLVLPMYGQAPNITKPRK